MAVACDIVEHVANAFNELALCSICTEIFDNPRMLACRHTFCLACLQELVDRRRPGEVVSCPMCRQPFAVPVRGLASLEKNLDVERIIETSRRLESRLKAVVLNCQKHVGKMLILYCKQCSELICPSCIVSDHAQHLCEEIDDAAAELAEQVRAKVGSVEDCLGQLHKNVDNICKAEEEFERKIESTQDDIWDLYEQLKSVLEEDRDTLLDDLSSMSFGKYTETKEKITSLIEKLELFMKLSSAEGRNGRQPLEVIPLCTELIKIPIEKLASENAGRIDWSFEQNTKLFKLRSKAMNLVGFISKPDTSPQDLHVNPSNKEVESSSGETGECTVEVRSMFGEPAVTDAEYSAIPVQPSCPHWCCCDFCEPSADVSERRCCASFRPIVKRCELASVACVTQLPGFTVNCLDRNVIEVAVYEQYDRAQELPKSIHEIYRDLACIRFRRWMYRVPRGHVANGVPSCAMERIRQAFPPEEGCDFEYAR